MIYTIRFFSILFFGFSFITSFGQNLLKLEVNSIDSTREVFQASNINDGSRSAVILSLTSGAGNVEAESTITTYADSYTASPGYGGYLDLQGLNTGIVLRASDQNGVLRFLTGGSAIASQTRMFISPIGEVGIGTTLPGSRLEVASGNIFISDADGGLILKSATSNCWKLTVGSTGALSTTSVSCP